MKEICTGGCGIRRYTRIIHKFVRFFYRTFEDKYNNNEGKLLIEVKTMVFYSPYSSFCKFFNFALFFGAKNSVQSVSTSLQKMRHRPEKNENALGQDSECRLDMVKVRWRRVLQFFSLSVWCEWRSVGLLQ